jgi:transcriptional regulator with XRE-family HTH domain
VSDLASDVGRRIKSLRLKRGFSQHELATAVGVSHSALGQIERGENKGLTYQLLDRIAHAIGAEPADLFNFPWHMEDRIPERHVARELIRLTPSEDLHDVIKALSRFVTLDKAMDLVDQQLLRRAAGVDE